jgi:hypothetical protein
VTDRVTFTKQSAERIAQVVRTVEAGNRDTWGMATAPRFSGGGGGGTAVRLAIYTATSQWNPISPFTTVATSAFNIKTIQFIYPTATASVGTGVIGVPGGPTAQCINNMAFLPSITTVVTNAIVIITVMKEAGEWRLLGASR